MTIENCNLRLADVPQWMRELIKSGIRTPRVRHVSPGTKIYRFASSTVPKANWAAGPWWFGAKAFQQIKRDAVDNYEKGFGMGWSGRRALAIRQNWSRCDVFVEATIAAPINIFCGTGTKQYREVLPNGMYVTWEGWPSIEQWYIPFINDRSGMTTLGKKAINVYRSEKVTSYQMFKV